MLKVLEQLLSNLTSAGQVHHFNARKIKKIIQGQHFLRFLGVIIKNLYLPIPISATPIGVSANNTYQNKTNF